MAFEHRLGYRFQGILAGNEFVEGFVGTALSGANNAFDKAIRKIKAKCEAINESFEPKRIILFESAVGLSADELKQIREDWKVSACSNRC